MSEETTILDQIDNIKVVGKVFEKPANEYWALICLWSGLEFLHGQVSKFDELVRQRLNAAGETQVVMLGNAPALSGIPKPLLTSAFHWYANSACQYVRTIGAIAYMQDHTRPKPIDYVKSVIPEVLTFRDKVAAHLAWTTLNSNDNDAERLASIMPPLGFRGNGLVVSPLTLSMSRSGKASDSGEMKPWGIGDVHEHLRNRYWPTKTV